MSYATYHIGLVAAFKILLGSQQLLRLLASEINIFSQIIVSKLLPRLDCLNKIFVNFSFFFFCLKLKKIIYFFTLSEWTFLSCILAYSYSMNIVVPSTKVMHSSLGVTLNLLFKKVYTRLGTISRQTCNE